MTSCYSCFYKRSFSSYFYFYMTCSSSYFVKLFSFLFGESESDIGFIYSLIYLLLFYYGSDFYKLSIGGLINLLSKFIFSLFSTIGSEAPITISSDFYMTSYSYSFSIGFGFYLI